ncbi:hypothetical protein [Streptomyces sp. AP-93]|uniref:hypothetical protein n=1 Tax=Streptomyces sp. AP-93 TaxID=2929048 RepID=UPI001FAEA9BA|nr:hypothetical protein [Streptomyces sp. AP-93]MCJ0872614.1 hypothetical protein [Streptomyces sp. AP-93]
MTLTHARRVSVRRATLQDVNAIVRMLSDDRRMTPQQAAFIAKSQPQLRLTIAHFGLEAGHVWVAESGLGALAAAAVWIPPGIVFDKHEQKALLGLHGLEPPTPSRSSGQGDRAPREDHVRLAAVGAAPTADDAALEALLSPALRWADAERLPTYATTLASAQSELLLPFGFSPWPSGSIAAGSWLRRPPQPL